MQASRWSSSDAMWEIVDKMKSLGIEPNEQTYALIINRMTTTESIELALQFMDELTSRGLTPQLTTAQDIVRLAAELNFPRLAVELAQKFEEQSVRRIDGETWMACLISSAEALYVGPCCDCPQSLLMQGTGSWRREVLEKGSSWPKPQPRRRCLHSYPSHVRASRPGRPGHRRNAGSPDNGRGMA